MIFRTSQGGGRCYIYLEPQTTIYKRMIGETTIFYIKIWNHPIETSIYKWLFGVPGSSLEFNHQKSLKTPQMISPSSKPPPEIAPLPQGTGNLQVVALPKHSANPGPWNQGRKWLNTSPVFGGVKPHSKTRHQQKW